MRILMIVVVFLLGIFCLSAYAHADVAHKDDSAATSKARDKAVAKLDKAKHASSKAERAAGKAARRAAKAAAKVKAAELYAECVHKASDEEAVERCSPE
jgi:hypothetical protein